MDEFINDTVERHTLLSKWSAEKVPKVVKLSSILNPHAFITAIKQVSVVQ